MQKNKNINFNIIGALMKAFFLFLLVQVCLISSFVTVTFSQEETGGETTETETTDTTSDGLRDVYGGLGIWSSQLQYEQYEREINRSKGIMGADGKELGANVKVSGKGIKTPDGEAATSAGGAQQEEHAGINQVGNMLTALDQKEGFDNKLALHQSLQRTFAYGLANPAYAKSLETEGNAAVQLKKDIFNDSERIARNASPFFKQTFNSCVQRLSGESGGYTETEAIVICGRGSNSGASGIAGVGGVLTGLIPGGTTDGTTKSLSLNKGYTVKEGVKVPVRGILKAGALSDAQNNLSEAGANFTHIPEIEAWNLYHEDSAFGPFRTRITHAIFGSVLIGQNEDALSGLINLTEKENKHFEKLFGNIEIFISGQDFVPPVVTGETAKAAKLGKGYTAKAGPGAGKPGDPIGPTVPGGINTGVVIPTTETVTEGTGKTGLFGKVTYTIPIKPNVEGTDYDGIIEEIRAARVRFYLALLDGEKDTSGSYRDLNGPGLLIEKCNQINDYESTSYSRRNGELKDVCTDKSAWKKEKTVDLNLNEDNLFNELDCRGLWALAADYLSKPSDTGKYLSPDGTTKINKKINDDQTITYNCDALADLGAQEIARIKKGVPIEKTQQVSGKEVPRPDLTAYLNIYSQAKAAFYVFALRDMVLNHINQILGVRKLSPFMELMKQSAFDLIKAQLDDKYQEQTDKTLANFIEQKQHFLKYFDEQTKNEYGKLKSNNRTLGKNGGGGL